MSEIEKAYIAHKSVSDSLKKTSCILRAPSTEILHKINRFPKQDKIEVEFRHKWFHGGDHELLQEILNSGRIPLAWPESWSPARPRTINEALHIAKKRGYSVPDKFLEPRNATYSEKEAWHAAYILVSNNFNAWHKEVNETAQNYRSWQNRVYQLTCQFIVPDPLRDKKTPYVLDQLWIVVAPENKVRLVALEIDGEAHLENPQRNRDRKRDVMLAAMGYEVYHVAGWWCRIDPYRVICEFLDRSGIFPNAHNLIIGHQLNNVSDYVCYLCGHPMVRWDYDWIQEIDHNCNSVLIHKECLCNLQDNLY